MTPLDFPPVPIEQDADCCPTPDRVWSGVYGTSPRRVFWFCRACRHFGAILFPRSDDEMLRDLDFAAVDREFSELCAAVGAEPPVAAGSPTTGSAGGRVAATSTSYGLQRTPCAGWRSS